MKKALLGIIVVILVSSCFSKKLTNELNCDNPDQVNAQIDGYYQNWLGSKMKWKVESIYFEEKLQNYYVKTRLRTDRYMGVHLVIDTNCVIEKHYFYTPPNSK